jgi:hypothetical protein
MRVIIERPSNGDGTLASTGFFVAGAGGTGAFLYEAIPAAGSPPTLASGYLWRQNDGMHTASGTDVAMWDAPIMVMGRTYYLKGLAYKHADIGELVSITASHMGASHTYMPLGDGAAGITGGYDALAIRWE